MMDKIPLEFWKSKNKVFEPYDGKGGFIIDIITNLSKNNIIKIKSLI
jgi:hypothetical protein